MAKTVQQAAAKYDASRGRAERNYAAARGRMGQNYTRGMTEFLGMTPSKWVANYEDGIAAGSYRYGTGAAYQEGLLRRARGE